MERGSDCTRGLLAAAGRCATDARMRRLWIRAAYRAQLLSRVRRATCQPGLFKRGDHADGDDRTGRLTGFGVLKQTWVPMAEPALMIVGTFAPTSTGRYLAKAARLVGLRVVEVAEAQAYPRIQKFQSAYQRFFRAEPMRLRAFSRLVVSRAERERVSACLVVGNAPLDAQALSDLRRLGVMTMNYSTDDPWNLGNWCAWRLPTLSQYSAIFTPRPGNVQQLRATGCPRVELLPFGYDPETHRPATEVELAAETRAADVVFIGGADADRAPFMRALVGTGLKVSLYGAYWDRVRDLRGHYGGKLGPLGMRTVLGRAKMSVCLVRRANRDEHVMRTYEEPAMGSCVVMEDTRQHRELFPGVAAHGFFRTPGELVDCVRRLSADEQLRASLKACQWAAVTGGENTYESRLRSMLAPTGLLAG